MHPRRPSATSSTRASQHDLSQSNTSRTSEPEIEQISFLLHGTPAPRCCRRPAKTRSKPLPPPNSPCLTPMPPRLLPLPIDRLMVLRDRLTPDNPSRCALENVSSKEREKYDRTGCPSSRFKSGSKLYKSTSSYESPHYEKKTEINYCQNSQLNFSDRESSLASSHPDLSIDLSSLTDSDHDTESSQDTDKEQLYHSGTESSRRNNYYSSSPLFVPQHHSKAHLLCRRSSYFSSETSSNSRNSSSRMNLAPIPVYNNASSSSRYPDSSLGGSSRTYNTHSKRNADLICVYVDTVSNTELAKYLRPCVTCHEPCCICPEMIRSCGEQIVQETSVNSTRRHELVKSESEVKLDTSPTQLKQILNEPTPKGLEEERVEAESQLSSFSQFLVERAHNGADSGNCTFDEKSHSSILSRRHLSLSLMQLSTAAQCARILAESLEGVLQLAKDEVMSLAESPVSSDKEGTPDSLQNALDLLKKTYPKEKFEQLIPELPQLLTEEIPHVQSSTNSEKELTADCFQSAMDVLRTSPMESPNPFLPERPQDPSLNVQTAVEGQLLISTDTRSSTEKENITEVQSSLLLPSNIKEFEAKDSSDTMEVGKVDQGFFMNFSDSNQKEPDGKWGVSISRPKSNPELTNSNGLKSAPFLQESYLSHIQCSRCTEISSGFLQKSENNTNSTTNRTQ